MGSTLERPPIKLNLCGEPEKLFFPTCMLAFTSRHETEKETEGNAKRTCTLYVEGAVLNCNKIKLLMILGTI